MPAKLRGVFAMGVAVGLAATLPAAERFPAPGQLAAVFKPFRIEQIALAPDGRHLAYAERAGALCFVMIMEVDHPERKATIMVGENTSGGLFRSRALVDARVTCLCWIDGNRLVYATSVQAARPRPTDEIRIVEADGKNARKLVDGNDLEEMWSPPASGENLPPVQYIQRRLRVLGGRADEADAILVEATGGRATESELFKVSLTTGKFESLVNEGDANPMHFLYPSRFLYDWQGRMRMLETPHFAAPARGARGMRGMAITNAPMLVEQLYRYRGPEAKRGWEDLDRWLGTEIQLEFRDTAETFYGQRAFPVAFDVDPNLLYFASNTGRDTYGLYALDLRTKRRTAFAVEVPGYDIVDPGDALNRSALVFDRQGRLAGVRLPGARAATRWLDPDLARLQVALDGKFAGREVTILDWDEARTRLLLLVASVGDPGRYFVYQNNADGQLTEFFRRAPGLAPDTLNPTTWFEFDTPAGVHLTGTLTQPRRSRIAPPPLLLYCRELPGRREPPGFNRDIEALADMGFVVVQVNYRGVAGFGARHRDAVKEGYDRIPIEDLRAAVKWIAAHHAVNLRRTALVGTGFGGYLALRAVQLFPNEFRCAVSIDAPAEPAAWLDEPTLAMAPRAGSNPVPTWDFALRRAFFERERVAVIGLTKHAATTKRPILIIQDTERRDLWESQGTSLRDALKRHGLDGEYVETTLEFSRGDGEARAKVFGKIADFLNDHVYDYSVGIGEATEVK